MVEGTVRSFRPDSYIRWCAKAADALRQHIDAKGYKAKDVHQRWSSIREDSFKKFVNGGMQPSSRFLHLLAEATGMEIEPPRMRFRPSMAPRQHHAGSAEI